MIWVKTLSLALFLAASSLVANGHLHEEHKDEPPHLKYTQEVNEAAARVDVDDAQPVHSHGHSHDEVETQPGSQAGYVESLRKIWMRSTAAMGDSVWISSLSATLLISAAPCALLVLIPLNGQKGSSDSLLKVLLAFGAGGLLGDAYLHLMEHARITSGAKNSHSHSHSHSHDGAEHDLNVGVWVFAGNVAFFVIEKLLNMYGKGHGHAHGKEEENLSHSAASSSAILSLVADFAHNFTDGLAIGASYLAGNTVGAVTTFTVLVHEVPHEIGDLALLVRAGYSKWRAVGMQLVTALGAVAGCLLALLSTDPANATAPWVLPFTAGGFLYLGFVSALATLRDSHSSFLEFLFELAALLTGFLMMYMIALLE